MTDSSGKKRYPWTRFLCKRTDSYSLDTDGFVADPENGKYGGHLQPSLKPISEIEAHRCTVVLGEPGIGKSDVLSSVVQQRREGLDENAIFLYRNLNEYSTDILLVQDIFASREMEDWKSGTKNLHLYLDSLDECLLRVETVAQILVSRLGNLPKERLFLKMSCRTGVWPQFLESGLRAIFQSGSVEVYEVVPLRRCDVVAACEVEGVDSAKFIEEVVARGVSAFAIKPVTLRFLIHTFKKDKRLPAEQQAIYLAGCRQLCEETNPSRKIKPRSNEISAEQKLKIACRIAALSVLLNKNSIWIGNEQERSANDLVLADIVGNLASEERGRITEAMVRETLDSGLFTSRGPERMGWAHQTYAEFLAAHFLTEQNFGISQIESLFFSANPSNPKLIPQLQQVAAFLASKRPDFLALVLKRDPDVLLRCDTSSLSNEMKVRLVERILDEVQNGNSSAHFDLETRERFKGLNHPNIESQLRPFVRDRAKSGDVRRLVVDIAEVCELSTMADEMLALALDKTDDYYLRANAAAAIRMVGNDAAKLGLVKLLDDESDPEDELKGHSLRALWPDHISPEELFKRITDPKNQHFAGGYASFLNYDLVSNLPEKALPVALKWVEGHVQERQDFNRFERAVEKIISLSWKNLANLNLFGPFARVIYKKLANHDQIFDSKELDAEMSAAVEVRRKLFLTIFDQFPVDQIDPYCLLSLLNRDDFDWLASLVEHEKDQVRLAKFAEALRFIFDWTNVAQNDRAILLSQKSDIVKEQFKGILGPTVLGSDDAKEMRRRYERDKAWKEKEQKPKEDWPSKVRELVSESLEKIKSGDAQHFWLLVRYLCVDLKTGRYDDEHQIDEAPSWQTLDENERREVLDAAKGFLDAFQPDIVPYLKENSLNFGVWAGTKAMRLIYKFEPAYLIKDREEMWKRWTPALLAYPSFGHGEDEVQKALVGMSYTSAQQQFMDAIFQIAASEGEGKKSTVYIVGKFGSYINRDLQLRLLDLAKALAPRPAISLLGELVGLGLAEAEKLLQTYVSAPLPSEADEREDVLLAARQLMVESPTGGWGFLWPILKRDRTFGREIILNGASALNREGDFLDKLNEGQIRDLYIWMVAEFPHSDRRGGGWVGPEERAGHLRDGAIRTLVSRGTRRACESIGELIRQLPRLSFLGYHLLEAQKRNRWIEWEPSSPAELLAMSADKSKLLVRNEEELMAVIQDSISRFEQLLHCATPAITDLWNTEKTRFRPKDENEISDRIKRHLDEDLRARGIIVNREVEIRRSVGKGTGHRTDIQVDAVTDNPDGSKNRVSVIVEVKGDWHHELMTAAESQLANKYLKDNSSHCGIYLVANCLCTKWDDADSRKADATKNNAAANFEQLKDQAKTLAQAGYTISPILLRCKYEGGK